MAAAYGNSFRTGRAKASPSTEPASPPTVVTDPECAPNLDHLRAMLDQLKGDICGKIDLLSCELRADISSVREELRQAIELMQQKLSSHDHAITELQRACTDHSDLLTSLDSTVSTLKAEVKLLTDKCEDLEGRARRNNIRLVGVPEGAEGVRPTEFIAQLLMDSLGLDELPLLDRAHRTLRPKPSESKLPRPFVIRVHFFHVRNDLLRRAGEASKDSPLLYQGKRLFLFPDYTSAVAKKRAAFTDVKRLLHSCPGVKFGLRFPATLRITLPGGDTHTFGDPATAMDVVKVNLKVWCLFWTSSLKAAGSLFGILYFLLLITAL